jgi:hypothetical protein
MNIFRLGALPYPTPVWDAASDAAAAAAVKGGEPEQKTGEEGGGVVTFDAGTAYAELDADSREWLQKANLIESPAALAKHAYNQEKLLGNAVRVPKDDAPQEEKDAFLDKLGRPKTPDEYKFEAPKDMPEGLPYDGELEKRFRSEAHALGLNPAQAAKLRDMFVDYQIGAFNGASSVSKQQIEAKAGKATETLEGKWGPLDGDTAKANFEIADRVFTLAPGGQEVLAELKSLGLVGPNKEILSAPLAFLFASIGTLYGEDKVLRGKADEAGNPFADGSSSNLTLAMKIAKEDPDRARSLISAAGKTPSDFGLK